MKLPSNNGPSALSIFNFRVEGLEFGERCMVSPPGSRLAPPGARAEICHLGLSFDVSPLLERPEEGD